MSRKNIPNRPYNPGFNSDRYGTIYNHRPINWATPRLASTNNVRIDLRREAAETCRNLLLTETFVEPSLSPFASSDEQQPIKKNQQNHTQLRATISAGVPCIAEEPPLASEPKFSESPTSNTNQFQGSVNSCTGNELAELLFQHQEKQLHSMKAMDCSQIRKWNSCSFLGENGLSKAYMNGLSPMHASAEQINQLSNDDNVRMANTTPSGQVTSLNEQGMPSVLSNQSASVAYVTPWKKEISQGSDGHVEFHGGDGFITPPTACNSGSTSLSSSDESASKWESLLRAKDGLICQKDQIIDRQKKTILQLQQQHLEMEAKLRQALTTQIVQGQPQNITDKLQEYQYDNARLRAQLVPVMADKDAEIAKLEKKLGETEYLLMKMEATLKDTAIKKDQEMEEIQNKVREKEKIISELQMKLEVSSQELQGLRKRIESLERYLSDTPTVEEHQNTVKNLKEAREESSRLKETIAQKDKKLAHMNKALAHKVKEASKLNQANSAMKEKVESLEKSVHKYRSEGPVSEIEFDDLKMEHERIQQELERTKKILENKHKKMKAFHQHSQQTQKSLQQRLTQEEDTVTALREEVGQKDRAVDELRKSVKQLAKVNQDLMEQNLNYKNVCEQHAKCLSKDRVDGNRRLWTELSRCVNELKGVVQICSARKRGEDPNMSLLLGNTTQGDESFVEDSHDEVEALRLKTVKVQELRSEIDQLRTFISDQYAEEVGNNCITQ